jgi:Protein of unknown function (DUF1488)
VGFEVGHQLKSRSLLGRLALPSDCPTPKPRMTCGLQSERGGPTMALTRDKIVGHDTERLAFKFTMLNEGKVVPCQISDAAMDELGGTAGTENSARQAQFVSLRDEIEAIVSDLFARSPRVDGYVIRIFTKHVKQWALAAAADKAEAAETSALSPPDNETEAAETLSLSPPDDKTEAAETLSLSPPADKAEAADTSSLPPPDNEASPDKGAASVAEVPAPVAEVAAPVAEVDEHIECGLPRESAA